MSKPSRADRAFLMISTAFQTRSSNLKHVDDCDHRSILEMSCRGSIEDVEKHGEEVHLLIQNDDLSLWNTPTLITMAFARLDAAYDFELSQVHSQRDRLEWARGEADQARLLWKYFIKLCRRSPKSNSTIVSKLKRAFVAKHGPIDESEEEHDDNDEPEDEQVPESGEEDGRVPLSEGSDLEAERTENVMVLSSDEDFTDSVGAASTPRARCHLAPGPSGSSAIIDNALKVIQDTTASTIGHHKRIIQEARPGRRVKGKQKAPQRVKGKQKVPVAGSQRATRGPQPAQPARPPELDQEDNAELSMEAKEYSDLLVKRVSSLASLGAPLSAAEGVLELARLEFPDFHAVLTEFNKDILEPAKLSPKLKCRPSCQDQVHASAEENHLSGQEHESCRVPSANGRVAQTIPDRPCIHASKDAGMVLC